MEPILLQRACASTERFVMPVNTSHYQLKTPCVAWTVHDLLNHLVGTLELGRALLSDTPPTVAIGPGDLPDVDLVGDEPIDAYRRGVDALLAAASEEALARSHRTPFGEMPGTLLVGFTTLDILVHGWDLARATDQDATLEPDLADTVLAFAHQTITDETREPRIGPAVAVAPSPDATATDRLVAFLGRTP